MTATQDLADKLVDLARLSLLFGRVDRITFHDDGATPESDTDHTVMLGLAACAVASQHYRGQLDVGLVAQYALVHDLVEAYAGDIRRVEAYGGTVDSLVVVADSTPVGEVLAMVDDRRTVAVLDEDARHGFALATVSGLQW